MKIAYHMTHAACLLASLLPLRVLYVLSDALFLIIYYVARYRRPLVRKNLTESFPGKSTAEITAIERGYYAWLCDYFVETVKMFSMSDRQMRRRMRFEGIGEIEKSFARGNTCSAYLGHYCNWEWITSLPLAVSNGICAQIYHPLENRQMDTLFLRLRERFGAKSIDMDSSFRTIMGWKKAEKANIVGYIADQVPGLHNVHCWVDFLNHDTPVFTGAERITMLTGADVFYADITRPRRGYYVCTFRRMPTPPGGYVKFHFTREYFRLLEESINRAPQYWLWSHNRWKRTREQFNSEYTEEERKRMLNRL